MGPVRGDKGGRQTDDKGGGGKPYSRENVAEPGSEDDVLIIEDLGQKGKRCCRSSTSARKQEGCRRGSNNYRKQNQSEWGGVDSGNSAEVLLDNVQQDGEGQSTSGEGVRESSKVGTRSASSEMVDYYKTLELSRSATTADIKKSYRKLALRWHPDKNPENQEEATIRFRELSEAYEVLIDEKKRKIYDQHGKEGLVNSGRPASNHRRDHTDPFAFDFGFGSPFGFGFGFPGFAFRDPEEVFREFFHGDPMADLMGDLMADHFDNDPFFNPTRHRHTRNQRPSGSSRGQTQNSLATPFFPSLGFGLAGPMLGNFFSHDPISGSGSTGEFFSTTTFGGHGGASVPAVKRTSTSTRVLNGKKIVTKKVVENGIETVTITENGVLKSKMVNGVSQAVGY